MKKLVVALALTVATALGVVATAGPTPGAVSANHHWCC